MVNELRKIALEGRGKEGAKHTPAYRTLHDQITVVQGNVARSGDEIRRLYSRMTDIERVDFKEFLMMRKREQTQLLEMLEKEPKPVREADKKEWQINVSGRKDALRDINDVIKALGFGEEESTQ